MGMPATHQRRWTAAEVRALIEESPLVTPRYELVDGELLVTPSPKNRHQAAVIELIGALYPYLKRQRVGSVLTSPSDIELEPESVLQPDVYVMPPEEALRREFPARALLLAVEVLSPGSARFDRGHKRVYYQRNGVSEYWIVDLDSRVVERWRPADERPEVLAETLAWMPAGATEPLVLDLRSLFTEVLGDQG
jgi:Uma2 family endonuclease